MLPVDILWICAMAGPRKAATDRASGLLEHWERRLEFYQLHVALRLQMDGERCARWNSFLQKIEAKLAALRMRRDILANLEQAATLDCLPIDGRKADIAVDPEVAERFAVAVAEIERTLIAGLQRPGS